MLEDGSILNENVAVLTWLSQQGDQQLGYPAGTADFYRMLNCTAFIASELHSTLGVLFYPAPSDEAHREPHAPLGLTKGLMPRFARLTRVFRAGEELSEGAR